MMAVTHSTIAAAGVSLILGTSDPLPLGLAILGSQLPDLDTTQSLIGQICFPLSSWIEDRFPHRSVTHSLLATATLTVLSIGLGRFWLGAGWKIVLALPLGHLLACFSDCFTKQGVQLFWPEPAWAVSVSNPRRRLTSGGAGELWVLAIASACLFLGIYVANGGGVTAKVNQGLGLRDGAIATYNQNAAGRHVWAKIEGVYASDRADASGKYLILDTAGREFIVLGADGRVFQTDRQIVVSKLTTEVGTAVRVQIQTLTFDDEDPLPKLELIRSRGVGTGELRGVGTGELRGVETRELRGVETRELRDVGVEELRGVGTGELRGVGTGELRGVGVEELRDVGTGELRDVGTGELRDVGVEESNDAHAAIFVTGNLTIDFPEDVELPVRAGYPTSQLSGATLSLSYEDIDRAIELLRDQYAIGSLSVKIVRPAPIWNSTH